jgi:DNA-binding HxlR family transcriptional regulator
VPGSVVISLKKEIGQDMQKNKLLFPINNTFQIIGKKFTLLILRNMLYLNQTRFNMLPNSIAGINAKTLSSKLKAMERCIDKAAFMMV